MEWKIWAKAFPKGAWGPAQFQVPSSAISFTHTFCGQLPGYGHVNCEYKASQRGGYCAHEATLQDWGRMAHNLRI